MNLAYDISVKIHSGIDVFFSLWLIFPDRWRLLQFFGSQAAVTPPVVEPPLKKRTRIIKWVCMLGFFAASAFGTAYTRLTLHTVAADKHIAGVYTVIPDTVEQTRLYLL